MNNDLELKLQAWLDGELSPAEARSIGREVAGNAEAGRLVTELQAIKSTMAGNELPRPVPETRDFFWSKIERQIQSEARETRPAPVSRLSAFRAWLSPLAGFAALACMMLLAYQPPARPSFEEISSTSEGMEAVTFNDQSTGMTVVWLADTEQAQPAAVPESRTPDAGESEVEIE